MSFIKSRILLAGAASLLALTACNSGDSAKTDLAKATSAAPVTGAVAATVNGAPISESHVKFIGEQRGDLDAPEARKKVIENLAVQLLAANEAIKKGLDKTQDVADRIELNRQSILATAFVQDYLKANPVTDEALQAEYDKIKGQSQGIEYKVRHIMVDNEVEAKDIIATLKKNPKMFETLAKQKSKDPGSKEKGGDIGWYEPHGRDPEFDQAVAKLAKGKFTETPVKSQFGYHVILLEDSRPKQAPPLEQLKPQLRHQAEQEKLQKLLDEMKAKAKIEITAAPASAPASAAAPASAKESKPAEPAKK